MSNRGYRIARLLAGLLLTPLTPAWAATMVSVGVLGNSGEFGPTLMHARGFDAVNAASGIVLDRSGTIWVSGGNSIVRAGLDGRLIERFPLEPAGSNVDSSAFVQLDGTLYFLGWMPRQKRALFALPMQGAAVARPLAITLPEPRRRGHPPRVGAQPYGRELLLAADVKGEGEPMLGVYRIDPSAVRVTQAFTIPGEVPQSIVVDAARNLIYIGGNVVKGPDKYLPGVAALRPSGTGLSVDVNAPAIPLPATPTWFTGRVSLVGRALWDVSQGYGFLARLGPALERAPGVVARWRHELDQTTQIIGLGTATPATDPPQPLLIATNVPDAFYLAEWNPRTSEFRLARRFGSLPRIGSLGLSAEGWVTASTQHTQLWWRWNDDAAAPPRMADMSAASSTGFFHADRFFAFGAIKDLSDLEGRAAVPLVFSPAPNSTNAASRPQRAQALGPIRSPSAVGVVGTGTSWSTVFVTDSANKTLYRTRVQLSTFRLESERVEPVTVIGEKLRAPTDLVPLTDGRLLLSDAGRVLLLAPRPDGLGVEATWTNDVGPGGAFGKRIRIAAYGTWLLVSDTDRHRVLWLDWPKWKLIAQFGETDIAGNDTDHLNGPTFVAMHATRAVIADATNQRILKVELQP